MVPICEPRDFIKHMRNELQGIRDSSHLIDFAPMACTGLNNRQVQNLQKLIMANAITGSVSLSRAQQAACQFYDPFGDV